MTDETSAVLGVPTVVADDQLGVNGVLTEQAFDRHTHDDEGGVWYFGEHSRELDANDDVISTEGSRETGAKGGRPGIVM